jgi:HEAT repeat protein
MKNLTSSLLALGIMVFACNQIGRSQEDKKEPVYQGKALKDWIRTLQAPDPYVRLKALEALSAMGPKAAPAIPELIRSLENKDELFHISVFSTLSQIGKPAVPSLLEIFTDPGRDQFIRRDAACALGSIGVDASEAIPELIKALKNNILISSGASLALATMGKVALPSLLEALKGDDAEIRTGAAKALSQMGPDAEEAVPILKKALNNSNVAFRAQAAMALAELHPKDQEALSTLIESLTVASPQVRLDAIHALEKVGPDARRAIPALESMLKKGDERIYAASAILHIQPAHRAAFEVIIDGLKDDGASCHSALWALERLGPQGREAVPSLMALLKRKDNVVVDQAVRLLGKIGPAAKEAVPTLIEALRDRKSIWIVQTLGEIGSSAAVSTLIGLVKDPDPEFREFSVLALGEIGPGSKAAVPVLLEALKDSEGDVRLHAISALSKIKPDANAILPHFLEALKDKEPSVRGTAVISLGDMGPEAKSAVLALLDAVKKDNDLTSRVAVALGQIGPEAKEGIPLLLELLKNQSNDPAIRVQAAWALWRVQGNREATLPILRDALKCPKKSVRIEAALALWHMGEEKEKMMALILDILKEKEYAGRKRDPDAAFIRFHAAQALGEIGPDAKAAVPILIELLGAEEDVMKGVPKALKKIDPEEAAKHGIK